MVKRMMSVALVTMLAAYGARAETETLGEITWTYTVSDGQASVQGSSQSSGELVIPSTLGGYPVVAIADNAFWGSHGLESVTIQSGVKSIGSCAFRNCSAMTSVAIPPSVTSIGYASFYECYSLTSVTIPPGDVAVGASAFARCFKLASVTISDGATSIGREAFKDCDDLLSVAIPSSVISIGDSAFWGCDSLKSVTIGEGVISICGNAFNACRALEEFAVADGNQFYKSERGLLIGRDGTLLRGINGEVTIPEDVTSIGESAFADCMALTKVTIPSSVTSIGASAFSSCSALKSASIAEGVKSIGHGAFSLSGLSTVTIPSSATIAAEAFAGCKALTSAVLSEGIKTLGSGVFSGCDALTTVTFPSTVTSTGQNTFWGCWALTTVTMPEGVEDIGEASFRSCRALASLRIPSTVKAIGRDAFEDCISLTSVTISEGVTSIGDAAFYCCHALPSVTIPSSVRYLGIGTFRACEALTSVTMHEGLTSIEEETFRGCSSLKSVTIPESVMRIRHNAFLECSDLATVTIPSTVQSIDDCAFLDCPGIERFVVAKDNQSYKSVKGLLLTKDGQTLVRGVNGDVSVPEGVTLVGNYAFRSCSALTSVRMPSTVTRFGYNPLSCRALTNVVFFGNAPVTESSYLGSVAADCVATIRAGTKGWDDDGDGKWMGLTLSYGPYVADPVPDIGDLPTQEAVAAALGELSDPKLAANITDGEEYAAFRAWANAVHDAGAAHAVRASPHAWLSYVLDCDMLIGAAPADGHLSVDAFKPSATSGRFDFTVGVKDVEIGAGATAENLKKVFGIEGGTSLRSLSSENVDITFGTPENGKVRFTAGPREATQQTFFMKVKMVP